MFLTIRAANKAVEKIESRSASAVLAAAARGAILGARVELMGESVVVVGDSQLMRIHIHTKNRNAVLNFARCTGRLSDLTLIKRVFKKFPNPLYQRRNQGRLNPFYR